MVCPGIYLIWLKTRLVTMKALQKIPDLTTERDVCTMLPSIGIAIAIGDSPVKITETDQAPSVQGTLPHCSILATSSAPLGAGNESPTWSLCMQHMQAYACC